VSSSGLEKKTSIQADIRESVPFGSWVVRDMNLKRTKPLWPYFESANDVELLRQNQPIRVKSCWNGIAAFNADFIIGARPNPIHQSTTTTTTARVNNTDAEDEVKWPLRFRESGPTCLTSECLSINYDLHRLLANDRLPKIFINPNVKVAYDKATFYLYNRLQTWRIVAPWHVVWEDWIANRMFWFLTDLGRKPAYCNAILRDGFNNTVSV
jgi:alpha-1,3-mannosyltransferase